MAQLAIGISSTVVQELVKRVKNAKEEEAKRWQTVERNIVFMKHEFEMMQSFLASAAAAGDGEGRFRADVVARTWVRQVRELSDGAEDCIDYVLHLDTERSFWTFGLGVLQSCFCMTVLPPLDRAVSDIEQLKAMVEDVSKRNMRYSGLGSGDHYSGSKTVTVPVAGGMNLGWSAASASTSLGMFVNASDCAKNMAATEGLIKIAAVADDGERRIFSVCGTGADLGGTISIAIARMAYEHAEFGKKFPLRAWVRLKQPFDPSGFARSLVDQFGEPDANQGMPEQPTAASFAQNIIRKRPYLVVLEDVLGMAEWDAARAFLPDENNGSRVIVLTHQLEIAGLCTGPKPFQVSPLRGFSPRHSVCVFYQEQEAQAEPSGNVVITEAEASGNDVIMEAEASSHDSEATELEKLITYKYDAGRVISVCAAKSSVVKTIYYRCLDRMAQEELCAWVVVPNPFNINELCRRLVWFMDGGSLQFDDGDFMSQCLNKLRSGWHLIFIDGLQSESDWDLIKTKEIFSGCCTVVVTKDEDVAKSCASDQSLVRNISDQADLAPHRLQYKRDDDDNNYFMRPKGWSRLARAYDWLRYNRLAGRDSCEENKLETLITSPDRRRDRHHVISVCGIARAGKSFVVKTIYSRCIQREMLQDLFGKYVWVDVPHPFEIMDFCRVFYKDWTGISGAKDGAADFVDICSGFLSDKRPVLVVIDGLRSTDDWDSVHAHLRLATSACCVVVVTRDPTVARYCATNVDEICTIRSLQEDATRRLIREKLLLGEVLPAGSSRQGQEFQMLTEEAFAMTNKCGRIPQVVISLGSYLWKHQGPEAKIAALNFLNSHIMQQLMTNRDLDELWRVFTSMHSNFHASQVVIKKCTFYLSIFHQESIRRDRLVRRWIAEGYSEGIDSTSMAVYTEMNLFDKLAELGMISKPKATKSSTGAAVNSSGTMRMSSFQVNSLFLEYITTRETEESIFLPLEVTVLEGGRSPPNTQHVGQHLAIRDWKGEKAVFDCLDFTRLRSLTVSGQWQPFFVSDMMLVLRVLDLEGTTSNLSDGDLKQIVKKLPRLKFLSVRGCRDITRLPRSVGTLRHLQTLDVRGTTIEELPESIVKLQKLQYLRAGRGGTRGNVPAGAVAPPNHGAEDGQVRGVTVPEGIGALTALHTLGAIHVSSSCLSKLYRLQQLRKLHVSGIIKKWHDRLCDVSVGQASSGSSIRFPKNSFGELKVLEIGCSPGMHVQFAGAVPKLEKVKLYWHDGSSPQFFGLEYLSSLKKIWLKGPQCNEVSEKLQQKLNQQIPKNEGSEREPSKAEGEQQIPESSEAEGNQQKWKPSPVEGDNQGWIFLYRSLPDPRTQL